MAGLRAAVALLPLALTACQWNHQFTLEDLGELEIGTSTRDDVERRLGPSKGLLRAAYSSSERDQVLPPAPLSFVLWPLVFHSHGVSFDFMAEYDEQNVLKTGRLEILEISSTRFLLFFGRADFHVYLDDAELEAVRRLQKKGIDVRIAVNHVLCNGGVIGWDTMPLDDYLRSR